MRIGWLVNEDNFERALSLRNGHHLPTTQCAFAEFEDFSKQRNGGGGGREDDLYLDLFHSKILLFHTFALGGW
jgi:hypothetical protein